MTGKIHCPQCYSEDHEFSKGLGMYTCGACGHQFALFGDKVLRRIFLSYGHDESSELAERLKRDLEARGHEVWFDLDRLQPGDDWEHHIEAGINWICEEPRRGLMLFLVTPHAARRPDGYCLNELSRALIRKLSIVPVMVVWCELPLSICRIQWLDMQECLPVAHHQEQYGAGFRRLCETIENERLDLQGGQARLLSLLEPQLCFDAELDRHLARFEGRQWLIDAIDRWLSDDSAGRVFWVSGKPGTGKSAMAAWLCRHRREIAAFHLCSYGHLHKADPRRCVLSIAYQLSTQLYEYQARLNTLNLETIMASADAQTLFDTLITQPLSRGFAKPDRRIVILIDGLDEATEGPVNRLASCLAEGLAKTPAWLRLIVTSRPDPQVRYLLQAYSPVEMNAFAAENDQDLRAYLDKYLRAFHGGRPIPEEILQTILDRSEGLFLYVHWVMEELGRGRLTLPRVAEFPQGLGGCYAQFFSRQFPLEGGLEGVTRPDFSTFKSWGRPLLELMTAAREPLTPAYVAAVLGWDKYLVKETVEAFGSLILTENGKLRTFHRTVSEWLTEASKAGPYFVSIEEGHEKLAEAGWAEYEQGVQQMHDYARAHLASHLIALKRWQALEVFLSDPALMDIFMAREKHYDLLGYWLAIGNNLDMTRLYQEALEHYAASETSLEKVAALATRLSDFLRLTARYEAAEALARKALQMRQEVLGPQHVDTATSLRKLGTLLSKRGDHEGAESLLARALKICETVLGPEHLETARSLAGLAALYNDNADYDNAELLSRRALAMSEKILGPEDPDTATAIDKLARVLSDKGDCEGAASLYRRALAIRAKALGPEHPDIALSLNNLASLLSKQWDFVEAEPLFRRALAIREKVLGPEHPDTATIMNNLASLLSDRGDHEEAESLYRRSLAVREKILGAGHPDTARSLFNLAGLLSAQGDYEGAESLYRRSLDIREKILGPEHVETASSLDGLACFLAITGAYHQAEPWCRRSLAIREKNLGRHHPVTAMSLTSLARLLRNQGKPHEAEALEARALAIQDRALGLDSPETALNLGRLAVNFHQKKDYAAAEPLYRRSLALLERYLGAEHPITMHCRKNLELLLRDQGKNGRA